MRQTGMRQRHEQASSSLALLPSSTGLWETLTSCMPRNHDDGTATRKYGHAEVLVLTKEPRKVSAQPQPDCHSRPQACLRISG